MTDRIQCQEKKLKTQNTGPRSAEIFNYTIQSRSNLLVTAVSQTPKKATTPNAILQMTFATSSSVKEEAEPLPDQVAEEAPPPVRIAYQNPIQGKALLTRLGKLMVFGRGDVKSLDVSERGIKKTPQK